MKALIYIASFCISLSLYSFQTIEDIRSFMKAQPEYPFSDNYNPANPDYRSFYYKHASTYWTRLLETLGLKKNFATRLYEQLKLLAEQRTKQGLLSRNVAVLKVKPGTQFIILSNVQGEFHSLGRILETLYIHGIIDERFKLTVPDTYLVFAGNILSNSPYILEVLKLITQIMYVNQENFFYLKGTYTDKSAWAKQALGNALRIAFAHNLDAITTIKTFFNTLPLGIYILSDNPQEPPLRISYFDNSNTEFNYLQCPPSGSAIKTQKATCVLQETPAAPQGSLTALVTGTDTNIDFTTMKGLAFSKEETPTWKIVSSPSRSYRYEFGFSYDAFAVLTIGKSLKQSLISLFNHHASDHGFKLNDTFSVVTGNTLAKTEIQTNQPWNKIFDSLRYLSINKQLVSAIKTIAPSETKQKIIIPQKIDNIITLGSSLDLSKTLRNIGLALRSGITLASDKINREGGINGKLYRINVLDDQYTPYLTKINFEQFIKDNITLILSPTGTATLKACLNLIQDKKVFILFPSSGADIFRTPDLEYIVHFRKSNHVQARASTEYIIQNTRPKSVALFYQNDSYGQESIAGALKALKGANINNITTIPYTANTLFQIPAHAETIKKANPDAIGLFATLPPAAELLRQLGSNFLISKTLFTNSTLGDESFKRLLSSLGLKATIAQVCPSPFTSNLEIVKEYRDELTKKDLSPDSQSLLGYIATSLTANLLQRINGTITKEALLGVIKQIKNYKFKGLTLNFNPQTHELMNYLWIETPQGKWLEYKTQNNNP